MLSRLAQGVTSVLQELSGEENPSGASEDGVNLQVPTLDVGVPVDPGGEEDTMERLAQMEELVVRLKEVVREKDGQLTNAERQLKEEREASEIRFSKLKLQAKAKMAALNKQISELKGQEGANTSLPADDSLTVAHGSEEEGRQLRLRLQEEETVSRTLREQLEASQRLMQEAEEKHSEQMRTLQAVVCEKDVRFREQVQRHEEELLSVTAQARSDDDLQQALRLAQRRTEELEEALRSRTQVLEMLQQELNSADQQKQILTTQFRQMEQELAEMGRQQETERQQWTQECGRTQAELAALAQRLEAAQREEGGGTGREINATADMEVELVALKDRLEVARREKEDMEMKMKAEVEERRAEEGQLRARIEAADGEKEELKSRMEAGAEERVAELAELMVRLEAMMSEKEEVERRLQTETKHRVTELNELKVRLEAAMTEKEEMERRLETEAEQRETHLNEVRLRLEAAEAEKEEMDRRLETESEHRVAELNELKVRLEAAEAEKEGWGEARMEGELASSKARWEAGVETQGEAEQGNQLLAVLWMGLHALAGWKEAEGDGESSAVPADFSQCEAVLRALEARLLSVEAAGHQSQVDPTVEVLQGELAKYASEKTESDARIQQLEHQVGMLQDAGHSPVEPVPHPVSDGPGTEEQGQREPVDEEAAELLVQSSDGGDKINSIQLITVQQRTAEDEGTFADMHAHVVPAEPQDSILDTEDALLDPSEQSHGGSIVTHEKIDELMEFTTDTPEEEKTLIAEDDSALSPSADSGGSPELISLQPESLEERETKGASSDEMVTSTDSEAVQSSWTLLEAGNQESSLDWTSSLQDFGQLQHQPWEQSITGHHVSTTSTVHMQSSSIVIQESVHVNITKQEEMSASQKFAQAVAEELQRRYTDLLAELQKLTEVASDSELRLQSLQADQQALQVAKETAEARALECEETLKQARAELHEVSQQRNSDNERRNEEYRVLEEQLASHQTVASSKDQKIQALEVDMDKAQQCIAEQDCQVRKLRTQIEEKEHSTSELEQRLRDSEAKLQDIEDLKLRLSQKEQEMTELTEAMSTKLLQAREEKFIISSEVTKLKEQVFELEKAWEEERIRRESTTNEGEQLRTLEEDKQELSAQLASMKKEGEQMKRRLQAALVQRKELMKKVEQLEKESERMKEHSEESGEKSLSDNRTTDKEEDDVERKQVVLRLESALEEANQTLRAREEVLDMLQQKIANKEQALTEVLAANQRQGREAEDTKFQMQNEEWVSRVKAEEDKVLLQSKLTILESERDTLQKKFQEALESQKETIRKAKEKDRHHREQLKHQKEEYNRLLERCEEQSLEKGRLLNQLRELEELNTQKVNEGLGKDSEAELKKVMPAVGKPDQPGGGDWGQEDWVDFAAPDTEINLVKPTHGAELKEQMLDVTSAAGDDMVKALKEEVQSSQLARMELEQQLKQSQEFLSLRKAELLELHKELGLLREKEHQIDTLSFEMEMLRQKCSQAEAQAEMLKTEVEAATSLERQRSEEGFNPSISQLKAEVEEFKQFLNCKNNEILELSQQLGEQNSLLQMMQETVSEKDQLISSLQDSLRIEKENNQKLEGEEKARRKVEKSDETKLQQLQRKLQAALISRKDALKESKVQKDEIASLERDKLELQKKMEAGESELAKLRAEREKLIEEVDRTLLENQSLGASCESLKLAMEGVLKEKDEYKQEADAAREQAAQVGHEWEEKVQGMKEEYETLLKSYENVSDEAERVRKVLEVARQERQELLAKTRVHETARQEAERLAEEAQKDVDAIKDKMRKFAKAKQQKIMDLEEENEKLREMEERKGEGAGTEHKKQKEELLRIKEEFETLKADLDATQAQRDLLEQEAVELREKLAQEMEKGTRDSPAVSPGSIALVEEPVTFQQSSMALIQRGQEPTECQTKECQMSETVVSVTDSSTVAMDISYMETAESTQSTTEDQIREMAFEAEKTSMLARESELMAKIVSFEDQLKECSVQEASLRDEVIKWEAKHQEVQACLEAEKDDLEERLMNQLAQVNGSIAGYQQEAVDSRERMVELQRSLEKVEAEKAEFEAQAKAEADRAARLEEDKRQAQRERTEAEAEVGRHRELEQKLKSAQRGKEGSQSRARQLEELLREKQLEVRHMQKDCIQYQEKISEQEREAKALQLNKEQALRELAEARLEATKMAEEVKKVEAELNTYKVRLEDVLSNARQAQAEKQANEELSQRREAEGKAESERTLDAVRLRLGAELKQTERRLEDAQKENEREKRAADDARRLSETRERQAQEAQSRLDESLARLAAFSRSMSSLQDDRDRVLDEARQWESRFHSTIQGKEAEVREAETRARDLVEQLQKEVALTQELQLNVERLQKAVAEFQHKSEEQERRHSESQSSLEKDRAALQEALAQVESSLSQKSAALSSLEAEAEELRHRVQALEEAVSELQRELEEARVALKEREMEERRLGLCLEQLETDLRSSKKLTETLQAELGEKERREVELLGEKEQAVAQAADEAKREAEGRAQEAGKEAERWREEARRLEERAQMADEESGRNRARLDAFTKAMGSLQDDRDRVLGQYKQLEERHLQAIVEKDTLIQEAAAENNGLKEELRSLLAQRDDLNSEKAKLSAQLHSYRDDLTQVLSMKDSQHKNMLSVQLERIAALEKEKEAMRGKIQTLESRVESENLVQASAIERQDVKDPEEEDNVVKMLEKQLTVSQERVANLEEALCSKQKGEEERNKELSELRWEDGVLRTQAETAEERVAELARDLVDMEQKLLAEREVSSELQAQNKSFGQAMASLQDSRDQALNEAQELRLRMEEMARTATQPAPSSPPAGSSGEVWALKNALSALQNDRERLLEQLQLQRTEVSRLTEEAAELVRLTEKLQEEKRRVEEALQGEGSLERQIREAEEQMLTALQEKDEQLERERREVEVLRLEREDWQAQAETAKQQSLATLSDRDEQVRQLSAMLEDARGFPSKVSEEQYQRAASPRTDLSSEGLVPQADSGQLSSQLNDTLRELHMKDLKITELSSKLSQVFEEKRMLSSQLRGSSQRLGEAQSRCAALQRQLQELQFDKRKGVPEMDSAPGAPQERSDPPGSDEYRAEVKALQRRLDEEQEQRLVVEEQLQEAQDRLKRYTLAEWQPGNEGSYSETAVLIEPPEGTVTRTRNSGPGLLRMLRGVFCSRQRTPLLATLYLLTVHALLLLCLGGYL